MANAFDSGFDSSFGWNGVGQIVLMPHDDHATYEGGDILVAKNRRAIRSVHAQHICWPRIDGAKVGGQLTTTQPLLEIMLSEVYQYKFERLSVSVLRRTDQWTLVVDELDDTPNENGERIDVALFVSRRLSSGKLPMFGAAGAEVWYGGRTRATHTRLNTVWAEIESRTAEREVNYVDFPMTPIEKRKFLALSVDDFTDAESGELTSSLIDDETDPENPVTIKKRKNGITDWRDLRDVVPTDVLNTNLEIDIRGIRKHVRSQTVVAKVLP